MQKSAQLLLVQFLGMVTLYDVLLAGKMADPNQNDLLQITQKATSFKDS